MHRVLGTLAQSKGLQAPDGTVSKSIGFGFPQAVSGRTAPGTL